MNKPYYVRVQVQREEWRLVEAVNEAMAENKACSDDEAVVKVIEVRAQQTESQ